MTTVVFAAGGTGGHIVPALSVAEALKKIDPSLTIVFIGVGKEIERKLIPAAGFELVELPFVPFRGRGIGGVFAFLAAIPRALQRARSLYKERKPKVVVGFGGYPSFMPVVMARWFNIPVVIHEQNVQVGLANRFLSRFAKKLFAVTGAHGFPSGGEVTYLPLPVRDAFYAIAPWNPPRDGELLRLLVLGGSQGAVSLNDAIADLAPLFSELRIFVTHQSGARDQERLSAKYQALKFENVQVAAFFDNVAGELEKAHLVISRAGAGAVAEISVSGRPAIYVPLPIAGGHQQENCAHVIASGGAELIVQEPGFVETLGKTIQKCAQQEALADMARRLNTVRANVRPSDEIANVIASIANSP